MSTRRFPLTVYSAKRRQRSISNPHSRPVPSSSPLKPLTHDADISVDEMSRRMLKRSRSSLKRSYSGPDPVKSASAGASPVDRPLEDARPAKRTRASTRAPLQTIVEPSHMNLDEEGTADMDLTDVVQLKTPVPRDPAVEKQDDGSTKEESDFLSPLPTSRRAKRVLAHRTSSSNLVENKEQNSTPSSDYMLLSPALNDLASPFHSRPGSPSAALSAADAKKALTKKLNRTRSVGTDLRRRATMRSLSRAVSPASNASSPGARRHPSLPNSQGNQKENQDWLVPAQLKQPFGQATPRRPSDTSVPFVRESSFFDSVPEACSTPQTKRTSVIIPPTPGRDIDATPRMPLGMRSSAAFSQSKSSNIPTIDEATPRAKPSLGGIPSALLDTEDSLFPDSMAPPDESLPQVTLKLPTSLKAHRRMTVHLSQDSIFSSASELSMSIAEAQPRISDKTKVEQESLTLAPPSSPMAEQMSPPSSDGDELRDMFSILGLDEDERWNTNSTDEIDAFRSTRSSAPVGIRTKKTRSTLSAGYNNSKQEVITAKARAARSGRRAPTSSISQALETRKRVLIMSESPPNREPTKKTTVKQQKARPTIKMRILDKPIQAASDSSDEINFLKTHAGQNSTSSDS